MLATEIDKVSTGSLLPAIRLGFGAEGLGVWYCGFRVQGSGFRVQD